MDILYLLIPLSVVLVLLIVALFGWAIHSGQLENLEREGVRIFEDGDEQVLRDHPAPKAVDEDQSKRSQTG